MTEGLMKFKEAIEENLPLIRAIKENLMSIEFQDFLYKICYYNK